MEYTFREIDISDLYKDAMGFRPPQEWCLKWDAMSMAEKQAEWDRLCALL